MAIPNSSLVVTDNTLVIGCVTDVLHIQQVWLQKHVNVMKIEDNVLFIVV